MNVPEGSHDDLGLNASQRAEEVKSLEEMLHSTEEALPPKAIPETNMTTWDEHYRVGQIVESSPEASQPIIPGASTVYKGLARIRAHRAQRFVDKARRNLEK